MCDNVMEADLYRMEPTVYFGKVAMAFGALGESAGQPDYTYAWIYIGGAFALIWNQPTHSTSFAHMRSAQF